MTGSDHYHSLTDAQLAEWHALTVRCERLTADLAESHKATDAVVEAAREQEARLRAEIGRTSAHALSTEIKLTDQIGATRRACGQLVTVLKALHELHHAITHPAVLGGQAWWPGEIHRAITDAEEVMRVTDIPF